MSLSSFPHLLHSLSSKKRSLDSELNPAAHLHSSHYPQNGLPNLEVSVIPLRSRLSQLCRDGRLDAARRLFDAVPRPAPTLLWNTLLIGYVCNSMPHHALGLYALMNSSSTTSDHYTYSSALKSCADARQLRLGKSIHCHIIRHSAMPPKNRVLNNSLLNMYASALRDPSVDVVRLVFDRMPNRNVVSWNTLISWYVRSQRPTDALQQFWRMVRAGVVPTAVSFVNVLPAVAACVEGGRYCDMLYGLLVKFGREYVNDLFVVSSAILVYSELSDTESARQVFDLAVERNIEVWNTMIGGYVQNNQFHEAIDLFVQVLVSDVIEADAVTFVASLVAVSQLQDVGLGKQVHCYLIKKYYASLPTILCNVLIVMYSRCGFVELAFELFHQMSQRDVVSWNTMISAFVQNDMDFEALLLAYEMQKEGVLVDSVTVTALLSAASNLGSLRIGKETHGYLTRHGINCQGLESYLIDMYAKSSSVETARRLFDSYHNDERDQVTWNAMIAGYTQSEQKEEALLLFRKMIEEGRQVPNSVTLSSVLPTCNLVGGIQTGKQMHGFAIRQGLDSNVFVGSALVDMYAKCGGIHCAERVFQGMAEKTTVTYTTMLSGLGQHGLGEKAMSFFQSMKDAGVKPDAITFVAVLTACSYSGLVEQGLAVFESMECYGVSPTPEHYGCVVDLLGRAGRVEEAYAFVQGLGDRGNVIGIWGSLLAACKLHGKLELGKKVSERLFEIERGNGVVGYHVLISNIYAAEGEWQNVDKVRKVMRDEGLRKEPGSSWVGVGDASRRFMSKDQRHPDPVNGQIDALLRQLTSVMKLSGYRHLDVSPLDGGC